jgi:hypothetical protein
MPSKDEKPVPRILQQPPPRDSDPRQQQSGSSDSQPQAAEPKGGQEIGEGSYEATRDYQKNIKDLKKADVEADAQKAKPQSEQEARDLEQAEKEGRSHSKG